MKYLNAYKPIAKAISILFFPHVEVVIHDLKSRKIAAIFNGFSKRSVLDESLIQEGYKELPDVFPVYSKINYDGRKIRSISVTIRSETGEAIGLVCINLDVSKWEELSHFVKSWLENTQNQERTRLLFEEDWKERINTFIAEFMKREQTSLKLLGKEKKRELIFLLHKEGAFKAKNASHYVAQVLDLSRATVYNYLRQSHANTAITALPA